MKWYWHLLLAVVLAIAAAFAVEHNGNSSNGFKLTFEFEKKK